MTPPNPEVVAADVVGSPPNEPGTTPLLAVVSQHRREAAKTAVGPAAKGATQQRTEIVVSRNVNADADADGASASPVSTPASVPPTQRDKPDQSVDSSSGSSDSSETTGADMLAAAAAAAAAAESLTQEAQRKRQRQRGKGGSTRPLAPLPRSGSPKLAPHLHRPDHAPVAAAGLQSAAAAASASDMSTRDGQSSPRSAASSTSQGHARRIDMDANGDRADRADSSHRYICDVCCEAYIRLEDYRVHARTHADVALACPVGGCDWTFQSQEQLARHMLQHGRVYRPFCCRQAGCDKRYKQWASLHRHLRSKHGIASVCRPRSQLVADHTTAASSLAAMGVTDSSTPSHSNASGAASADSMNGASRFNSSASLLSGLAAQQQQRGHNGAAPWRKASSPDDATLPDGFSSLQNGMRAAVGAMPSNMGFPGGLEMNPMAAYMAMFGQNSALLAAMQQQQQQAPVTSQRNQQTDGPPPSFATMQAASYMGMPYFASPMGAALGFGGVLPPFRGSLGPQPQTAPSMSSGGGSPTTSAQPDMRPLQWAQQMALAQQQQQAFLLQQQQQRHFAMMSQHDIMQQLRQQQEHEANGSPV